MNPRCCQTAAGTVGGSCPQKHPANQRAKNTLADGSYWVYGYDSLGQVTNACKYWADGTPVAGPAVRLQLRHDWQPDADPGRGRSKWRGPPACVLQREIFEPDHAAGCAAVRGHHGHKPPDQHGDGQQPDGVSQGRVFPAATGRQQYEFGVVDEHHGVRRAERHGSRVCGAAAGSVPV